MTIKRYLVSGFWDDTPDAPEGYPAARWEDVEQLQEWNRELREELQAVRARNQAMATQMEEWASREGSHGLTLHRIARGAYHGNPVDLARDAIKGVER